MPELFDPIHKVSDLPEVTQENLPVHAEVPRGSLRLVVFRERLPRLSTFTLWHVLQSPLRLPARFQAEHVSTAVCSTPAGPEWGSRSSCRRPSSWPLFHQSTQLWRDYRREGQHDEAPALPRRFVSSEVRGFPEHTHVDHRGRWSCRRTDK